MWPINKIRYHNINSSTVHLYYIYWALNIRLQVECGIIHFQTPYSTNLSHMLKQTISTNNQFQYSREEASIGNWRRCCRQTRKDWVMRQRMSMHNETTGGLQTCTRLGLPSPSPFSRLSTTSVCSVISLGCLEAHSSAVVSVPSPRLGSIAKQWVSSA